jgi:four helix bundle protein
MELLVESYRIALLLPDCERYGLAAQIRRAAVSIPANIAEGCGRVGTRDRLRFFSFARGSVCELQTLLAAVVILNYAPTSELTRPKIYWIKLAD